MGWLFTMGQTRKQLIKARTQGWEWTPEQKTKGECLAHCCRGNTLWKVMEITNYETGKVIRFIGVDLMANHDRNFSYWGYKDMTESMGPAYFTCPEKYLDMVPLPDSDHAQGWRDKVRAYHQLGRDIKAGVKVRLFRGFDPDVLTVISKRPFRGKDADGRTWTLERGMIKEIIV